MEITTTITTAPYCTDALPRLAMPSAVAFGRGHAAAWAVKQNVPGVPVWSPPHC